MPKIRSNRGPRFRFFTKGLVGLVILLLAAESASAYTSAAMTKANTNAPVGLASLISPLRAGFVEPYTESSSEMVSAGEVIELAQYGSVRRVSRRTARRTSRRN
jgi:hypothetical protein